MKKIYTIQIIGSKHHPYIWYANRVNQVFQAELSLSHGGYVIYNVATNHVVYPEDCLVLGVREAEQYFKK